MSPIQNVAHLQMQSLQNTPSPVPFLYYFSYPSYHYKFYLSQCLKTH